jgi:hypothetical protein
VYIAACEFPPQLLALTPSILLQLYTPGGYETGPPTHDVSRANCMGGCLVHLSCSLYSITNAPSTVRRLVTLRSKALTRLNLVCSHCPLIPPSALTISTGSSHCFGLRIIPIFGDAHSTKTGGSTRTGGSIGEYNIWRRWEDCLWFQDTLEERYGVISREKRQRLQAGKGVKKNGIYIHDRAASFESLPPGPDPKSVAMDIHKYLPRLTKRAALFRVTQQNIDQRQSEFIALIKAFFQEDVPSLIQELRQDRVILDFFGYWRRDYDLANKERAKRPKTASGPLETTPISIFTQSSLSLSVPASDSLTQVQRSSSSSRWRSRAADSMTSLSDSESAFSRLSQLIPRRNPSSAPARVSTTVQENSHSGDEQFSRRTTVSVPSNGASPLSQAQFPDITSDSPRQVNHKGSKTSSSPRAEAFDVASDFPLFLSSSTRDQVSSSRPPHSPTYSAPGLGTLPEDSELGSPLSSLPPPTPRNRKDASTDRAFRNCIIWNDNDEASLAEGDVLDREVRANSVLKETVSKYTSSSSLPSSIALSNFSPESRRSSWRSSSELAWPASPSSAGSPLDPDFPHWAGTNSVSKLACSVPLIPTTGASMTHRSLPDRCPPSHAQPQTVDVSVPAEVGDGGWSDFGEDFIDTYFGGSETFSVSNEDGKSFDDDVNSPNLPLDVGEDPADRGSLYFPSVPAHRGHYGAFVDEPEEVFPLSLATARPLQRSPSPQSPMAVTPTLQGVPLGSQMVTVKAVLDNSIVVFRVRRDTPLEDLRRRVHDKFARTEGIALHGAFAMANVVPIDNRRASSISRESLSHAVPIQYEEDWATAVADCGMKITLRVYYPS